jgi:radical SAM superfamily enzyme YgiQ (UPF0313 family)
MIHDNLRILLVYPQYPETFWSFKHALKFVSKKAAFPPLGLLTIASMLPDTWEKKLVDMNTSLLMDRDIKWADYVFISAMSVQRESAKTVISRCRQLGTKIVAGGPLFTMESDDFTGIDHFVLNEAEITLPQFIDDLENNCTKRIYRTTEYPDICMTPIPSWELIDMKKYSTMSVQYSRGCPFNCEFCDIVLLNGHRPRTKEKDRLLEELDALYSQGWRNSVFIVDDNFIGNKRKLKAEILPAIIEWMNLRKYPFSLFTEASINLADDEDLIQLMVKAGFDTVFVGIETPNEESLTECGKSQNKNRDLVTSVKKLQNSGLQVHGGFIVGFDNDPTSIFENQINFIQKSGIVTAMVGLLNAPPGTKLYQRLKRENRLTREFSGNNTDCSMNFIPKMNHTTLLNGYQSILNNIYSPKKYYERIKTFLREYKPSARRVLNIYQFENISAFIRSIWVLGMREKGRRYYWRLLAWTLVKKPRSFQTSVTLLIYGLHFRKVVERYDKLPSESNA